MKKTIDFNIQKNERKKLVEAIADFVQTDAVYTGAPGFAYRIGAMTVDKDGILTIPNAEDAGFEVSGLLGALTYAGFVAAVITDDEEDEPEDEPEEPVGLTVEIPLENVNTGLLTKLLDAKGSLIKKALGVDDLRIEIKEDRIAFPWFGDVDPDTAKTYTAFIAKLCEMTKNAKRVTATEKAVDNEKYAFRCFLLRLGFIGDEYKAERKILLKNLSGSSAYRNGGQSDEFSE